MRSRLFGCYLSWLLAIRINSTTKEMVVRRTRTSQIISTSLNRLHNGTMHYHKIRYTVTNAIHRFSQWKYSCSMRIFMEMLSCCSENEHHAMQNAKQSQTLAQTKPNQCKETFQFNRIHKTGRRIKANQVIDAIQIYSEQYSADQIGECKHTVCCVLCTVHCAYNNAIVHCSLFIFICNE